MVSVDACHMAYQALHALTCSSSNTSLVLQDFALARYAQRHSAGRAEFYITD